MTQPIHAIPLTNAAAIELLTLAQMRGLLTDEKQAKRVSDFIRKHLRTVPDQPKVNAEVIAWAEIQYAKPEAKEKTRDALKALVQAAATKGALSCGFGAGDLLEVLGLAEADE